MPRQTSSGPGATPWTICDGLFEMPLPGSWRFRADGYMDGMFELPGGQALGFRIESIDAPEVVANGNLVDLVREPGLDIPPLDVAEIIGNILIFVGSADDGTQPSIVWKSVGILGDTHIRIARFSMPFDPESGDMPSPETGISGEVTKVINQGRFADRLTPLDRVAPTKDMKRVSPWGLIHIRVPAHWRYEQVEDGRYVCDVLPEQMPPDPTLWFDYDQYDTPPGEADLVEQLRNSAAGFAETLGSSDQVKVDHDEAGSWVESVSHGYDGDTPLIEYVVHRFVAGDARVTIAHFKFVLTSEEARTQAGQALTAQIYREIRNAIVLPALQGE